MDRPIVYAGQVPRALDNLNLGEFTMVGLSKLAEALLGTGTIVSQGGFAVTPGNGLNIAVGPGQVYQLESIETQALSALAASGTQILKQGVALNAQTETLALTAAAGQAQNFLVEVAYADVNDGSVVLSFQNPTPVQDPATGALKYVTYPGPGGSGASSFTILRGAVSVVVKPGTPAQTGQQVTPAPDAGYVGLYVITLGYGATSVTSGNIAPYAAAPFLPTTLPAVPLNVQSGKWRSGIDTGTASNLVIALNPQPAALTPLMEIIVAAAAAPTGATVANVAGLGNLPVVRRGGLAVAANDWAPGDLLALRLNTAGSAWMLGAPVKSDMAAIVAALAPLYTASAILYVRNDATGTSPTGLTNAVTDAFPTLDAAIAYGTRAYYFPGGKLTIQLGVTGTYAPPSANVAAGSGTIVIQGDPANQASYILQGAGPSPGGGFVVGAQSCVLSLIGLTVVNTGTINSTVGAFSNGVLSLSYVTSKLVPAGSPYAHVYGAPSGQVNILPGCIFSGSAGYLMLADAGIVEMFGNITFSGAPTFSIATAAAQDGGKILAPSTSYTISGTAAGPRYAALGGGVINTSGGGANFFPGSSAGSTASGGQYL